MARRPWRRLYRHWRYPSQSWCLFSQNKNHVRLEKEAKRHGDQRTWKSSQVSRLDYESLEGDNNSVSAVCRSTIAKSDSSKLKEFVIYSEPTWQAKHGIKNMWYCNIILNDLIPVDPSPALEPSSHSLESGKWEVVSGTALGIRKPPPLSPYRILRAPFPDKSAGSTFQWLVNVTRLC